MAAIASLGMTAAKDGWIRDEAPAPDQNRNPSAQRQARHHDNMPTVMDSPPRLERAGQRGGVVLAAHDPGARGRVSRSATRRFARSMLSRSAPCARVSGPARQGRDRRGRARRTGVRGDGSGRDVQPDAAAARIAPISSGGGREAGTGGAARRVTPGCRLIRCCSLTTIQIKALLSQGKF